MAGNAPPHGREPRRGAIRGTSRGAAHAGPPRNVQPPAKDTERHQDTSLAQDGSRSIQERRDAAQVVRSFAPSATDDVITELLGRYEPIADSLPAYVAGRFHSGKLLPDLEKVRSNLAEAAVPAASKLAGRDEECTHGRPGGLYALATSGKPRCEFCRAEGLAAIPSPAAASAEMASVGSLGPEWEPLMPLGATGDLPAFPVGSLPEWGAAMVEAVAESTQTPPDLAGVVYLGVLAAAAGGCAEVEVQPGWREPVNLYAAPAMPSGSRKSAVFREMIAPLLDVERVLQETARTEINEATVSLDIARKQAEWVIKQASTKLPGPAADAAKANAIDAQAQADAITVRAWPRLVADDATPEALTSLLCEQGGRIAVLSAEGDLFDIMSGRYSRDGQVPNLGVFLKGHAGDLLLVDRKGREPERIKNPALTIVVTIQPQVLFDIGRRPVLRGRGLLARMLYCLPPDTVGFRRIKVDTVPDDIRGAFHSQVKALALSMAEWTDPAVLMLTPEARRLLSGYQEEIEPRLRASGGDLADLRDWASKLAGATVRLAGLLHLAAHLRDGYQRPVEVGMMERAIQLGRYFTEHARGAFQQMGMDPLIGDTQVILAWIKRDQAAEVSKRNLFNGVRSARFQKAADLDECLALLIDHGYLRVAEPSSTTKRGGRPSSPRYAVHPEVLS